MSLTNGLLRSVLLCVPLAAVAAPPTWPEATQESKPWVYNWWMGSAVDEKGLEAQCAALAEKGFGGFHVIPGAARPVRMYHDSFEYYEAGWTPQISHSSILEWRTQVLRFSLSAFAVPLSNADTPNVQS